MINKDFFLYILYSPIGIIIELAHLAKKGSNYIINKIRYKHAIIDRNTTIDKNCVIGKNVHILRDCYIRNYCSISQEVICGLGNHPLDYFSTSPLFYHSINTFGINVIGNDGGYKDYQPIKIGNDVWIGARAIILDGVTIGDGACIAAGAIVTKNVPSYAIVAGIPAKIIRYRIPEEKQIILINTKWWNLSPYEVYNKMKENDL